MPLVGSSRMMTCGCVASHLAMTTFCWLPPDSSPTSWSSAAARRSSRLGVLAGEAELLGEPQEAAARGARERGQGDVLEDRQADDGALPAAVLRHVDDAGRDRVGRDFGCTATRPSSVIAPREGRVMPKSACITSLRPAPTRP